MKRRGEPCQYLKKEYPKMMEDQINNSFAEIVMELQADQWGWDVSNTF